MGRFHKELIACNMIMAGYYHSMFFFIMGWGGGEGGGGEGECI